MSDSSDPAPPAQIPISTEAALDEHGYDPALYQWLPVLRKPRKDGWTPQRQRDFIAALADCACVEEAARAAGMTPRSCYNLRRESPQFAAAWEAALAHGASKLVDLAFDRAIHGSDEPVFDGNGRRVGRRMRQNDRLMMFLLRAYRPERFRHAHRDGRATDETLPPPAPPVEDAIRLLEPVAPPEPHRLMPPDDLSVALECAEILDGKLPHWHRGRGDAEYDPPPPVDLAFERALENAKREGAGMPPVDEDWLPPGYGGDAFLD